MRRQAKGGKNGGAKGPRDVYHQFGRLERTTMKWLRDNMGLDISEVAASGASRMQWCAVGA